MNKFDKDGSSSDEADPWITPPRPGASASQKEEQPKLYQSSSSTFSKSTPHLDFLDDDDDVPFCSAAKDTTSSSSPIIGSRLVPDSPSLHRSESSLPTPAAHTPVSAVNNINSLFDSSESDEMPFSRSSHASEATIQSPPDASENPQCQIQQDTHDLLSDSVHQAADLGRCENPFYGDVPSIASGRPVEHAAQASFGGNSGNVRSQEGKTGRIEEAQHQFHSQVASHPVFGETVPNYEDASCQESITPIPVSEIPTISEVVAPGTNTLSAASEFSSTPGTNRSSPSRTVDVLQEHAIIRSNLLRPKSLAIGLQSAVLAYKQIPVSRYADGEMVMKTLSVFDRYALSIPTPESIKIKDAFLNHVLASDINEKTPLENIEKMLGVKPRELIPNDLLIKKDDFASLLLGNGPITTDKLCEMLVSANINEPFVADYIRTRFGIGASLTASHIDPAYFRHVVRLNSTAVTRAFVESQPAFMAHFVVFYKLGLVALRDFATAFYNNIAYVAILKKIRKGENLSVFLPEPSPSTESRGWSFKSVLDFGISKILSVDSDDKVSEAGDLYKPLDKQQVFIRKEGADRVQHPAFTTELPQRPVHPCPPTGDVARASSTKSINQPPDAVPEQLPTKLSEVIPSPVRALDVPSGLSSLRSIFNDDDDLSGNDGPMAQLATPKEDRAMHQVMPESSVSSSQPPDTVNNNTVSNSTKPSTDNATEPTHNESAPAAMGIYANPRSSTSSSNLSSEKNPVYKKQFSKSFADIFSLGSPTSQCDVDVSSFVDDVDENDKPMLIKDHEEGSKSSIFNVFGIFKKKDKAAASQDTSAPPLRPLRATMKIPDEPKKRAVIKGVYANKKPTAVEIPGATPQASKKQIINPDRTIEPSSPGMGSEMS